MGNPKVKSAMHSAYVDAWKSSDCWWIVYAMGWNVYDGGLFVTREDF